MSTSNKRCFRRAFLGVLALAWLSVDAAAQVSPFRRVGLNLTKEDFALIETAAAKLYATDNPKIGGTEAWSNEKSKTSGVVVLVASYTWNNLPCRRMSHQILTAARKDPYSIQVDRCRIASGEWKVRY